MDASANAESEPVMPETQDTSLPKVSPGAFETRHADDFDPIVAEPGFHELPVVGLGGSAGAIAALARFFESTPAHTGLAYVVVLHLAPDHHSMLAELLQRHCPMPVQAAEDAVRLEADKVYVIPAGKHLTTAGGHLRLTDLQPAHGRRVAVDLFFRSLADTHGPSAIAIVLSGDDGDGALGLKRIKERGGLTIAQDPGEAEHPSMPRSAVATGMVDWVLRVAEMPRRITAYRQREQRLQLPPEAGPPPTPLESVAAEREQRLREVLECTRARTGRDFSDYKRATVVRRIARRMQVNDVDDMAGYLNVLRAQPAEAAALVAELLISVTNFFRDREAFAALEPHLAALLEGKRSDQPFRVWVPGCATGEEAYSLAMLLLEHARKLDAPPMLQVFACDLDHAAIRFARAGLYPETIAADVSEERLQRFFVKLPSGYLARRELREMVLFATHDVLKDAPFSRLDLLSCRNLLIYLTRDAQERCFEIFNFALNPEGLLFLGASETVPERSPLFTVLDHKHRIHRQRPTSRFGMPIMSRARDSAVPRLVQPHETLRDTAPDAPSAAFAAPAEAPAARIAAVPRGLPPAEELHLRLLGRWGPASVLIDAAHDIVHLSENASAFLQFPQGAPTNNLLRLALPALRGALRSALLAAQEQGGPVEVAGRAVELANGTALVDLRVAPAGELARGHHLVLFETRTAHGIAGPPPTAASNDGGQDAISNEELKASNEDLQAMNEELRSAGEELESGREELQSLNEELTTLNVEFKSRVEELSRANSDLYNLMSATQIATVFLDRGLRIMRYTPSAAPLFNFIASDIGRPISDLKQQLDYPQLMADAEQVLGSLMPVEREMRAEDRWLLARVLPYRTVEDRIAGVVVTLIDITDRKTIEGALQASEQRLRMLADAVPQIIWTNDREGRAIYFNRGWYGYCGLPSEVSVGPGWQAIVHPDDRDRAAALWQRALAAGAAFDCEYRLRRADGSYRWFIGRNVPTRDAAGAVDGWFGTATDIDDLKNTEVSLRESQDRLQLIVDNAGGDAT